LKGNYLLVDQSYINIYTSDQHEVVRHKELVSSNL